MLGAGALTIRGNMSARFSSGRRRAGAEGLKAEKKLPNEEVPYELSDAYRIMRSKILKDGWASSQIESFNDFVMCKIPQCLSEHPPIVVAHDESDSEHIVEILGVRFDHPSVREANGEHRYITPHECHLRRISYSFMMLVTARYCIRQKSTGKIQHTVIFRDKVFDKIPCMKFSDYCTSKVDPEMLIEDESEAGGYFLSTGAEKTVIGQEGPRTNYPFITKESDGSYKCECRSFNEIKYRSTSTLYITLTPSFVTEVTAERRASVPRLTVVIPFVTDPLPLSVAFKLLNVLTVDAMVDYVCVEDDPDWFKARVLDVLLHNIDAVVMTHEFAVTRLAHDRGQSYSVNSNRKRRQQDEAQAAKRRRKKGGAEPESEYERSEKQVAGLLSTEFLPHQGYSAEAVDAKAVLFGNYVRKLLMVYFGMQDCDDRDDYRHRRVALCSTLMTLLFRKHWTMWRRRLASQIRRDLENGSQFIAIKELLRANIGNHLQTALSTGDFSMHRGVSNLDGVGQVLSRTEPHTAISHVNRTSNPMNKDGRAIHPRLQHPSCLGVIDPYETPEGQSCGLMRNKSPMAGIRVGYSTEVLIDAVTSTGRVDAKGKHLALAHQKNCQVFVSGTLVGTCIGDAESFIKLLRARRAVQDLPYDVSIFRTRGRWATTPSGEIHINGDPGSFWWPLIRVDRMHEMRETLDHVTNEDGLWSALLSAGIIEVINKDEEPTSVRCALDMNMLRDNPPGTFTHVVIHPSQICSVFAGRASCLEYNQAPRITYCASMMKQAVGRGMSNARFRADTASHTLWYPQRPLVSTFMDETLSSDGVCSVQNPVVCIMCNGGFNIEDSLIFDQGAIDRGLFRSTVTRTTRDVVRNSGDAEYEELGVPPVECRSKLHANYSKINPKTGTVDPNTSLEKDDVIISKFAHNVRKYKEMDEKTGEMIEREEDVMRDRSTTVKSRENCVVDDVIMSTTLEGEQCVRLKTRAMRIPEVGDKFASRYGQKGTIGCIYPTSDMPFSAETGLCPSIILNPHAIPSRMTIGHLIETLMCKLAALTGVQADGTPFTLSEKYHDEPDSDKLINDLGDQLEAFGFERTGNERMIDGRTGKVMQMSVFTGPISYQKLKHMVVDKYHARSRGPKAMQTMQPVEGRHREGGQRFGEMEKDSLVAHGATELLQERLLFSSDKSNVPVCTRCGQIAAPPKRETGKHLSQVSIHSSKPFCHNCLEHDTVVNMEIPYAYKTSVQELQALHLSSKFLFDEKTV